MTDDARRKADTGEVTCNANESGRRLQVALDRARLTERAQHEHARFIAAHPRSSELATRARQSQLGGVPMGWMTRWPGSFPVFVTEAQGARLTDVDGNTYIDFCLGEGAALCGHAPPAVVEALARQAGRGLTHMLPTEDALWVAEELGRRFG